LRGVRQRLPHHTARVRDGIAQHEDVRVPRELERPLHAHAVVAVALGGQSFDQRVHADPGRPRDRRRLHTLRAIAAPEHDRVRRHLEHPNACPHLHAAAGQLLLHHPPHLRRHAPQDLVQRFQDDDRRLLGRTRARPAPLQPLRQRERQLHAHHAAADDARGEPTPRPRTGVEHDAQPLRIAQ